MSTHAEKRFVPYAPDEIYALVADIERYPEFLPWCLAARIRSREGNVVIADLVVGFRMFRERFTSKVILAPAGADNNGRIDVAYSEGPFRYLANHWIFEPTAPTPAHPAGGTLIDFYVDFEFHSRLLQSLIGALFNEAVRRMVAAFEDRARQLYGDSGAAKPAKPKPA